jgi:hypothetical protein
MGPGWPLCGRPRTSANGVPGTPEAAAVSPVIAEITGTAPRGIEQFARDYATAFAGKSPG